MIPTKHWRGACPVSSLLKLCTTWSILISDSGSRIALRAPCGRRMGMENSDGVDPGIHGEPNFSCSLASIPSIVTISTGIRISSLAEYSMISQILHTVEATGTHSHRQSKYVGLLMR